jgi:hypothetical protein
MPKYVAPNLRGPKLVWVPSKSGWMCVGTMALEAWLKLISYLSLYVDSSIEAYCNSIPMPSQNEWSPKYYNIQVSWSSCGWFIGIIWWLANVQVESLLWIIMS